MNFFCIGGKVKHWIKCLHQFVLVHGREDLHDRNKRMSNRYHDNCMSFVLSIRGKDHVMHVDTDINA